MPQISYAGAFNSATLSVPDVYLNVLPPKGGVVRPASVGVLAIRGVASWGPVDVATPVGSLAQLAIFGAQTVRKYDLVTAAVIALQTQLAIGAGSGLMLSRATDGTDAAATVAVGTTGVTITSKYTGTAGNSAAITLAEGSSSTTAVPTWKATITMPGFASEVFDNIGGTANALWVNIANAINNGNSPQRGPSDLVIATAGASTSDPTAGTSALTGGTDGVATITSSVLVGSESGSTRTGIYSFRALGCSDGTIADFDDHTQESTLITFAKSEGIYWHTNGPAGETPTTAQSAKQTAGTDDPWLKVYLGDWVYWNDNVNGQQRLLGPSTFGAAVISTLQPQQSGLNKQVPGVVATQRSKSGNPYANQELATLTNSGIEAVVNPIPRGNVFGLRIGKTSSSDGTRNTDNWPRLTSFIARSLAGPGALGPAIGQVITDEFFRTWYDVLDAYLSGLKNARPEAIIQNYQISFSRDNNPQAQTAQGIVVAEVLIQYLGIAQVFLVNLQTGATVVIPQSASSFALSA